MVDYSWTSRVSGEITYIKPLVLDARIDMVEAVAIVDEWKDILPSENFLEQLVGDFTETIGVEVKLTRLSWYGEGSGNVWPFFEQLVAPCIKGTVEAIVVCEGGRKVFGFSVHNGAYKHYDVEFRLVAEHPDDAAYQWEGECRD